jgi:hypothetical protein
MERNPHLLQQAVYGAMPYGGEKEDHDKIRELEIQPYLFKRKTGKIQLVYAGAMLPKAYSLLEEIFKVLRHQPHIFNQVEFHFIGTGRKTNDPESYSIKAIAEKYGLWGSIVFEYPQRIPYLDVFGPFG